MRSRVWNTSIPFISTQPSTKKSNPKSLQKSQRFPSHGRIKPQKPGSAGFHIITFIAAFPYIFQALRTLRQPAQPRHFPLFISGALRFLGADV
jgi:hypothetical protein